MTVAVADTGVLAELRQARRRHRVAKIHWIDAFYNVYITALFGGAAVLVLSGFVGDERLSASGRAEVIADGPGVLGLLVAAAVLVGLRSGCRGGPLALEKPDVRHVLLSPVDRGAALRVPAQRQIRFFSFVALALGVTAGQLAVRRLGGNPVTWVVCGAGFGLALVWLATGLAMVAAGRRLPRWAGTAAGLALVAWSGAELVAGGPAAPTSYLGHLALWPVSFEPLALVAVVAAGAALVAGVAGLSGLSLEAAERRTALVGQLRFAVTLQDLRTVLVLRRQLALEVPRSRPWFGRPSSGRRSSRYPTWQRGWRGLRRFPGSRLVRLLVLAVVAGLALRGAWAGTTPLVVLGGLALWVAALDVIEPLSQETDHPGRSDAYPRERGLLMLGHLPVPALGMVLLGVVAAASGVVVSPSTAAAETAAVLVLPASLAAGAGAVVSVLMGAPKAIDQLSMSAPEIAGMRTVLRSVWPPVLAVLGTVPLLVARAATPADQVGVGAAVGGMVLTVVALVAAWVRYRDDLHAWFERSMAEAKAAQDARMAPAGKGEAQ